MALEDDIAAMNRNRVQRGMCLTVDDLAMQVQSHQGYLTNIVNEFDEQITNITEGTAVKVIRGLATAAVTGGDFQIDNIVSLTDGFAAPSAPLDVTNVIGFSCPDNHVIYAILNPGSTEWEGWTAAFDSDQTVKIIGGLTTGTVSGGDFTIDTIVSFTSGYTHPTSTQAVENDIGFSCGSGYPVFAIRRPDTGVWVPWTDTDTGTGGSYSAGYGLELDTSTFRLDDLNYSGTGYELPGSAEGVFMWDSIQGWLQELDQYSGTSGNSQSIGHESGSLAWFPMASLSIGLAAEDVLPGDPDFDADNFGVLSGISPSTTEEITNTFNQLIVDNEPILIARFRDADNWHVIGTSPPRLAMAIVTGTVPGHDTGGTADLTDITWTPLGVHMTMTCLNPSEVDFVGGSGIKVMGGVFVDEGGVNYFVLPTVDPASRPGYTFANAQSVGKDASGLEEWQDDGECE